MRGSELFSKAFKCWKPAWLKSDWQRAAKLPLFKNWVTISAQLPFPHYYSSAEILWPQPRNNMVTQICCKQWERSINTGIKRDIKTDGPGKKWRSTAAERAELCLPAVLSLLSSTSKPSKIHCVCPELRVLWATYPFQWTSDRLGCDRGSLPSGSKLTTH